MNTYWNENRAGTHRAQAFWIKGQVIHQYFAGPSGLAVGIANIIFGTPTQASIAFGAPTQASITFGDPTQATITFGTPK